MASRIFGAAALVGLLAGCAQLQPTDSELTGRDWAKAGEKRDAAPQNIWCYRTVGRPDCYPEPLPGEEYRLIEGGVQPPPPPHLPKPATAEQDEGSFLTRARRLLGL